MRRSGLLAFEYGRAAAAAQPWYERDRDVAAPTFAGNADDLAGDYERLGAEVLGRFNERLAEEEVMTR